MDNDQILVKCMERIGMLEERVQAYDTLFEQLVNNGKNRGQA